MEGHRSWALEFELRARWPIEDSSTGIVGAECAADVITGL
jgi:hypothetical protein